MFLELAIFSDARSKYDVYDEYYVYDEYEVVGIFFAVHSNFQRPVYGIYSFVNCEIFKL